MSDTSVKFNPQANYTWQGADLFQMDGATLQFLYNNLAKKFENPHAQEVIADYQMFQAVQGILARAVEAGQVVETLDSQIKTTE